MTGRFSLPAALLRLEGLAVFILAVIFYAREDLNWWLFAILFLAPDLSAVGYLAGKRAGAICYNIAHTDAMPVALGIVGLFADNDLAIALALIWAAHIGMDRTIGYGLKYSTDFKDTHLSRV